MLKLKKLNLWKKWQHRLGITFYSFLLSALLSFCIISIKQNSMSLTCQVVLNSVVHLVNIDFNRINKYFHSEVNLTFWNDVHKIAEVIKWSYCWAIERRQNFSVSKIALSIILVLCALNILFNKISIHYLHRF